MLRKTRITLGLLSLVAITLLFLDFTGTIHSWLGWLARVQFVPALLGANVVILFVLIVLTLLFGRIYCSVLCPLGVMQDVVSSGAKRRKRHRFSFSPALRWVRWGVLALFVLLFIAHFSAGVSLLDPYAAYGRIAGTVLSPLWQWGNNGLAYLAERSNSYAFYPVEVWIKSVSTLLVAVLTWGVVSLLAWRSGRTYCNVICPVGTLLGFLSPHALLKPRIDLTRCNGCGLCARDCKASCIDSQNHRIDYSRCVVCFDCVKSCRQGAVQYEREGAKSLKKKSAASQERAEGNSRRSMLALSALAVTTAAAKLPEKNIDGGLAFIEDQKQPLRATPLAPAGAGGVRHFHRHCTACQLCVSVCPNRVLRPSSSLEHFMQPEMSYERGYCRPECVRCSEVCPSGSIRKITPADKSATQIGHAVWIEKNCVVLRDGVTCGNCADHCPTGAIQMVHRRADDDDSPLIPMIDIERCIGCGACEHLCPSRPFSAIYVEGHLVHRTI